MKKIFRYIFISVFTLLFFSCSEDWLEIKPLSIFVPESIYVDREGMDALLLNLRKNLRYDYYGSTNVLVNELMSSDCAVSGVKGVVGTHNFNTQVTPTGTDQNNFFKSWNVAYNQVRNANVLISRIDNIEDISEEDKNELLAEGYFHRAYWYYRLVHQFGDVPFLNKEYTEPKIDFYTHSRKTILDKIQSDMEFAVQWLPDVVEPGKVNRAAGNHLLTKIYLANSDFDSAITAASAVINDGMHSLMTERFGKYAGDNYYNLIWDLHQKENKSLASNTEGILVVQDKYGYPDAETSGGTKSMRNYVSTWWHGQYLRDPEGKAACTDARGNWQIIKLGRGVAYARPTNYSSYDIWKDCGTDLRHDTVINWFPIASELRINNPASKYYGQFVELKYTNPLDTFQTWFPWPHYKVYVEDEEKPDRPEGGHSDWYLFRLAETYLLRAEAYVWKENYGSAAADINVVRERALAPPVDPSDVDIGYILDERARELMYEEPRKTELTRIAYIMADNNLNGYSLSNFHENNYWFDRLEEKNNFYNKNYIWGSNYYIISPYHVLYPIPQDVIDDNQGGVINQNLGYPGTENNIPPRTEITEED